VLLTLCASVGNKKVSTLFDARCNHEIYRDSTSKHDMAVSSHSLPYCLQLSIATFGDVQ